MLRLVTMLALSTGVIGLSAFNVAAQQAPGINPQRDCQTIRTCRYDRGGSYRGCVSSYSCRACEFVTASCNVGQGSRRKCQRLRCGWGA